MSESFMKHGPSDLAVFRFLKAPRTYPGPSTPDVTMLSLLDLVILGIGSTIRFVGFAVVRTCLTGVPPHNYSDTKDDNNVSFVAARSRHVYRPRALIASEARPSAPDHVTPRMDKGKPSMILPRLENETWRLTMPSYMRI